MDEGREASDGFGDVSEEGECSSNDEDESRGLQKLPELSQEPVGDDDEEIESEDRVRPETLVQLGWCRCKYLK